MATSLHEHRIFETEQFRKDLQSIARAGHGRIAGRLRRTVCPQLKDRPHFGPHIRKLKGYAPETWRYRIGSWRFFFEIDDQERVVSMIAASHRGSAY
ncbi:MAG: type II toxin-antitoxin system RelE/ParE family toxin [Bryobacterales bacterium]|nr:type II toxin-antitoxin system RelE/ParE family toxin [Bryobacterales bacterium]